MSRVDNFDVNDSSTDTSSFSRVSRNSRLYQVVSSESDDLQNLPLDDNSRDIDINKLKEIISDGDNNSSDISRDYDSSFWESKKRNIDENKIYDINKLLEKAKYENGKLKDTPSDLLKTSKQILSKLEINDDYHDREDSYEKDSVVEERPSDIEMTREMKFHTKNLSEDALIDHVMPDNDLAMDLFFDLKPTGDTLVTEPIREDKLSDTREIDLKKVEDTSDIDIIKGDTRGIDRDFFTSSYEFSSKDFSSDDEDDDDEYEDGRTGSIVKIIFLIIGILLLIGVIIYFVINFGFGN